MVQDKDTRMEPPDTGRQIATSSSRHPRRCIPKGSVTLPQERKPQFNLLQQDNSPPANADGRPGWIPHREQLNPGWQSASVSGAEEWFRETNENVSAKNDCLMHEPPFYLDGNAKESRSDVASPHQMAWGAALITSKESENSDLRDVIDDLTVENRSLKRKLRKYQKNHSSLMHNDKMLEVRVHGLSTRRQRDLEDLLENFVTKVNVEDHKTPRSSADASLKNIDGASSQLRSSNYLSSVPADSGYASVSKSGVASHPHSAHASNSTSSPRRAGLEKSIPKDKEARSYLHSVPGLLISKVMPRAMSEREQKKLVVQRLEHIFTGRLAAPGPHSQPLQQQEVSKSAALESSSKCEGAREANIMTARQRIDLERSPKRRKYSHSEESDGFPHGHGQRAQDMALEQRPTRPLDLDVHRAQIPLDNLQYIRHLGLPSPMRHNDQSNDGWVYLNLLISMAQLHTINVTREFVKLAIAEMSDKFELSSDGRKVRWKGGEEGTRFSSDSGSDTDPQNGDLPPEADPSQQQSIRVPCSASLSKNQSTSEPLTSHALPSRSASQKKPTGERVTNSFLSKVQISNSSNPFEYRPMVYRPQKSSGGSEEYGYPEYESPSDSQYGFDDAAGHSPSNVMAKSGEQRSVRNHRGDGPMIYYQNSKYYTDLHGERKPLSKAKAPVEAGRHVLGIETHSDQLLDSEFRRAIPKDEVHPVRSEEVDEASLLSWKLAPLSSGTEIYQDFQEFPVSGLGGVIPDDNFLIDVKTRHSTKESSAHHRNSKRPTKNYVVVSAKKLDLPASRLPPPSYIFLQFSSSSSSSCLDEDSSYGEYSENSVKKTMAATPAILNQLPSSSDEKYEQIADDTSEIDEAEDEDESDEDEHEDNSICMLHGATAADPEMVAAQEQVYDLHASESFLPNEVPAGSSAATVGGSGYASPVWSPVSMNMASTFKHGRRTKDS